MSSEKSILDIGREIHAISKTGLAFSKDAFDIERFKQLEEIAADLIAKHSLHSKEYLERVFSAERGYVTPKLDVRAAVFKGDKILMVKEKDGGWTLPGGYVDVNESLSQAVEREVLEESGLVVKARELAAVFDHRKHGYKPHLYHFYKIYVLSEFVGGKEKTNIETVEVSWHSKSEINSHSLDPGRVTKEHIFRMFDHHQAPTLPTDFD